MCQNHVIYFRNNMLAVTMMTCSENNQKQHNDVSKSVRASQNKLMFHCVRQHSETRSLIVNAVQSRALLAGIRCSNVILMYESEQTTVYIISNHSVEWPLCRARFCLITDLVSGKGNVIGRVRLSVRSVPSFVFTLSFEPTNL